MLDEREFELVNIIGSEVESNQRDLSGHLKLSLGATNMLIRRLVTKGYIRIQQLNKRKVKYILTPKGFSEKLKKSIKYTMKTVRSLGLIKEQLKVKVITRLYEEGVRNYTALGQSDFALLIEMLFVELNLHNCKVVYVDDLPKERVDGYLLVCKEEVDIRNYPYNNIIDLIHELAQDGELINSYQNR